MDRLALMLTFVKVAETGSLTQASDLLGVSRATVSHQIASLEKHLGARLFNRTTRRVTLTEVGRAYLARCREILAEVEMAEAEASELTGTPRGQLRLSAPVSFGILYLGEPITQFATTYPEVEIQVQLTDRFVDVVAEGFDVVVRISQHEESSLIARPLARCRLSICASPTYIERYGLPRLPGELADHRCLYYSNDLRKGDWVMHRNDETEHVRVRGPICANNGDILRYAALQGLGIVSLPAFFVEQDIRGGRLREILPEWSPGALNINVLYPSRSHLTAKVRVFVDFLMKVFHEKSLAERIGSE